MYESSFEFHDEKDSLYKPYPYLKSWTMFSFLNHAKYSTVSYPLTHSPPPPLPIPLSPPPPPKKKKKKKKKKKSFFPQVQKNLPQLQI